MEVQPGQELQYTGQTVEGRLLLLLLLLISLLHRVHSLWSGWWTGGVRARACYFELALAEVEQLAAKVYPLGFGFGGDGPGGDERRQDGGERVAQGCARGRAAIWVGHCLDVDAPDQ